MSSRNLLLVLLAALLLVAASCGGSGDPSPEAYSEAVVLNRNRVDFVLARITRAKSQDELLTRMDEASLLLSARPLTSSTTRAPPRTSSRRLTIS